MLDTLIQQLGRELQMENQIIRHEPGHYTIPFENNLKVDAFQKENYSLLKSPIANLPPKNAEAFIERVMEINLYAHGTRGALIGFNEEDNQLTLSMEIDNQTFYKDFFEKIEDFLTVHDFWRKEAAK